MVICGLVLPMDSIALTATTSRYIKTTRGILLLSQTTTSPRFMWTPTIICGSVQRITDSADMSAAKTNLKTIDMLPTTQNVSAVITSQKFLKMLITFYGSPRSWG